MNDLNYINEFCQHGLMLTMHNSDFQQKERILRLPRAVTKWDSYIIRQFINSLKVIIHDLQMPMPSSSGAASELHQS